MLNMALEKEYLSGSSNGDDQQRNVCLQRSLDPDYRSRTAADRRCHKQQHQELLWEKKYITILRLCNEKMSVNLSCTAQRQLGTIFIQKSKPKHAFLHSKIVINFVIDDDWWLMTSATADVISVPRALTNWPLGIWIRLQKCHFQSCFTDWYLQIFSW